MTYRDQYESYPCYARFEAARRQVPRYLFRAASRKSGGDPRLNTATTVIPLGFLHNKSTRTIYDMTEEQIGKMAYDHYFGHDTRPDSKDTEFSSWSSSFIVAGSVAADRYRSQDKDVGIYVLDTHAISNNIARADVYVMPDIEKPGGREKVLEETFNHEFLIHGPVKQHDALNRVTYHDLLQHGIWQYCGIFLENHQHIHQLLGYPVLFAGGIIRAYAFSGNSACDVTTEELEIALSIAELFDEQFQVVIVSMLLSLRPRRWIDYRDDNEYTPDISDNSSNASTGSAYYSAYGSNSSYDPDNESELSHDSDNESVSMYPSDYSDHNEENSGSYNEFSDEGYQSYSSEGSFMTDSYDNPTSDGDDIGSNASNGYLPENEPQISTIAYAIESRGLEIPEDWCRDEGIVEDDVVEHEIFPEVKQHLLLMRYLAFNQYGRGY